MGRRWKSAVMFAAATAWSLAVMLLVRGRMVAALNVPGSFSRASLKLRIASGQTIKYNIILGSVADDFASVEAEFRPALRDAKTAEQIVGILEDVASTEHTETIPTRGISPNIAALALRRLIDVCYGHRRGGHAYPSERELVAKWLPELLETVGEVVLLTLEQKETVDKPLSLYSLSDTLVSLARMSTGDGKMTPLAIKVCNLLEGQSSDKLATTVGPKRLVEMLESLATLQLSRPVLLKVCFDRLEKGDALSRLLPADLATVLHTMAELDDEIHGSSMKAFTRRWRKKPVRSQASIRDLCRAISAARRLGRRVDEALYQEAETLVFTLLRELSDRHERDDWRTLSPIQSTELLSACATFGVNASHPIVSVVCGDLCEDRTLQRTSDWQVALSLASLSSLGATDFPDAVYKLGERFLSLAAEDPAGLQPRAVNTILRSAVLLFPHHKKVLEPFVEAIKILLMDAVFLSHCDAEELSNFPWILWRSRTVDSRVLISLAEYILESDFANKCTPKMACRVLVSYTSLLALYPVSSSTSDLQALLTDLFESLGTHLLSSKLTPAEVSGAMYAYAKASYVRDMGIFDHLAELLCTMLDECSIRQVTQSLWACGKMNLWEPEQFDDEESADELPYMSSAKQYVSHLTARVKQLNAKDVSQCLWALGRLGTDDVNTVYVLAFRASQLASECNSQEIANILWGLSRLNYQGPDVVASLTSRVLELSMLPSPQESANILYALGRMDVRDDRVFANLSQAMMDQLDEASAQAIANVLWAHRAVGIAPPKALLDRWAAQKLGLQSVPPGMFEDE